MPSLPPSESVDRGEPYCSNCGYVLAGAIESSKCPECGKPIVEVLMRPILEGGTGKRFRNGPKLQHCNK